MKSLKLGKKAWFLLGIGVLLVIAFALATLRNQQVAEQKRLEDELTAVQTRLANLELDQLTAQQQQVREQINSTNIELRELQNRVGVQTDSITASGILYDIAVKCGVTITDISASEEQPVEFADIPCTVTTLEATAKGDWQKLTEFITLLRSDFMTARIDQVSLTVTDDPNEPSTLRMKLQIYTYQGS